MDSRPICVIEFQPVGRRVTVPSGATLLEAGQQAGLVLTANCGGVGVCGRCRVTVTQGEPYPPVESEHRVLSVAELAAGQRLACRVRINGDTKVHVPHTTLASEQRLQLEGELLRVRAEAAVRRVGIDAIPPSFADARSDFERVCTVLNAEAGPRRWMACPAVIRQLSPLARQTGWRLTAYVRDEEIVGFEWAGQKPVGVAFDLGCTKIAGYLVDLETGDELAVTGIPNPQLSYGEDLISRLVFARKDPANARTLAARVRAAMNELIGTLVEKAGVDREQIVDVCVVGNTAMMHLFLELPIDYLLQAPYVASTGMSVDVPARELELATAPGAYVHVLPCIGGWVGADHVAVIMARGLDHAEHIMLAVDIGTNTEIALSIPEKGLLLTASCASGPALEGGHIRNGMRAAGGAIESIRLTDDGPKVRTIADLPPVGICGSGIVDVAAELWREGIINHRGHLRRDAPGVRKAEDGYEYLLVSAGRTGHGKDIVVTQNDISEIQLAKAAIFAGIQTLLDTAGTDPDEVREIVVAGAFGSFLNLDSAVAIGFLPRLPNARYVQAGNAAGVGAKMALVSKAERARARRVARRAVHIELKTKAQFNRCLTKATLFPVETIIKSSGGVELPC